MTKASEHVYGRSWHDQKYPAQAYKLQTQIETTTKVQKVTRHDYD